MNRLRLRNTSELSQIGRRHHSQLPEPALQHSIRAFFRRTAQHVAVLTTVRETSPKPLFHGATLSSFTSISLAPLPLVAFSLRLPSRAASSIDASAARYPRATMVVNILSAEQADVAYHFSRPDLFPDPFAEHGYRLSEEGIPLISGSLGALSCTPVTSFPLNWAGLSKLGVDVKQHLTEESEEQTSELFLAQVVRVETMDSSSLQSDMPLLYHDRKFKQLGQPVDVQRTSR